MKTSRKLERRLEQIGFTDIEMLESNFPYNTRPGNDAVTWTGYAVLAGERLQLYSYFTMREIVKLGAQRYDKQDYQIEIVPNKPGMGGTTG